MKPVSKNQVIRKLQVRDLKIHPYAQREIVQAGLKDLIDNLDLNSIGTIHAVEYKIDGVNGVWVVDGQTRLTALRHHGFDEWVVDVVIHTDIKDHAGSARLFLRLNNTRTVSNYWKYVRELTAGFPEACGVDTVLRSLKLKVEQSTSDGTVSAVKSLKMIWSWDYGRTLRCGLESILEAWGDRAAALEGKVIEGVSRVICSYDGKIDRPALIKILSKYRGGPSGLLGTAKTYMDTHKCSMGRAVANCVILEYNNRRRVGRLDEIV